MANELHAFKENCYAYHDLRVDLSKSTVISILYICSLRYCSSYVTWFVYNFHWHVKKARGVLKIHVLNIKKYIYIFSIRISEWSETWLIKSSSLLVYSIDEKKINIRVRKKDEYIYTSMILLLTRYWFTYTNKSDSNDSIEVIR